MEEYLQLFVKETSFYNQIVLGSLVPQSLWNPLPHVLQTWLRNYIGGVLLYLLSGGLWALYIYYWKRNHYLPKGILFLLLLWILDLVFPSFLRLDSSVWIWICPIWAARSCMLRLECGFVDLDGLDLESSRRLGILSVLIGFSPSIWSKWMKNQFIIIIFFYTFVFEMLHLRCVVAYELDGMDWSDVVIFILERWCTDAGVCLSVACYVLVVTDFILIFVVFLFECVWLDCVDLELVLICCMVWSSNYILWCC